MGVKFGKGKVWCGSLRKPTANLRELTRIAFFLRSGALLRLIACAGIAPSLEKCWEKPARGFFSYSYSIFLFLIGVRGGDCGLDAESGRPQQSKFLICDPVRSVPRWGILISGMCKEFRWINECGFQEIDI